jgi:hypothetical protein
LFINFKAAKMKNNGMIILMLTGTVCLFSCTKKEPVPESKVHDKWGYLIIDYDSVGSVVNVSSVNFTGGSTVIWGGGSDGNGDEYAVLFTDTGFLNPVLYTIPYGMYKMKNDGLHSVSATAAGSNAPWLKYPGVLGETVVMHNIDNTYTEDRTLVSTNATVTVPAGTFGNQHLYEFKSGGLLIARLWFNEHEWFVKYEVYDSTGTYVDYTYELMSYSAY